MRTHVWHTGNNSYLALIEQSISNRSFQSYKVEDLTAQWLLDLNSPGGQINANFILLPTDVEVGKLKHKIRACFGGVRCSINKRKKKHVSRFTEDHRLNLTHFTNSI